MADGSILKIKEKIASIVDSGAHISIAKTSKEIGKLFGLNERLINYTHVELRNKLNEYSYKVAPYEKRILFLPQCLRISNVCKAPITEDGFDLTTCEKCEAKERCQINQLKNMAYDLGYMKVAVTPGGSMVHKIIARDMPKAVLGVCCYNEAVMALDKLKNIRIGAQAVLLLKDGCKDTQTNVDEVKEKLEMLFNGKDKIRKA